MTGPSPASAEPQLPARGDCGRRVCLTARDTSPEACGQVRATVTLAPCSLPRLEATPGSTSPVHGHRSGAGMRPSQTAGLDLIPRMRLSVIGSRVPQVASVTEGRGTAVQEGVGSDSGPR